MIEFLRRLFGKGRITELEEKVAKLELQVDLVNQALDEILLKGGAK